MDVTTRRGVYLRDRSALTPAQRRRLKQKLNREIHSVVPRASRLRKVVEKATRTQLRWEGLSLMQAIRTGRLSPRSRADVDTAMTIARMRQALAAQPGADSEA